MESLKDVWHTKGNIIQEQESQDWEILVSWWHQVIHERGNQFGRIHEVNVKMKCEILFFAITLHLSEEPSVPNLTYHFFICMLSTSPTQRHLHFP